ncbi:MAG TPA: hypothetical protein VGG40_10495 [Solirubrobacterales bacterium]
MPIPSPQRRPPALLPLHLRRPDRAAARADRHFPVTRWLDGLIAGFAVAARTAAPALGPIAEASIGGSSLEVATDLAYPIADLTLLALVVSAAAFTGWRTGATWSLLGALIVLAISDVTYLLQLAQGSYFEGDLLDAARPLGALLLVGAAWVAPGHGAGSPPRPAGGGAPGDRRPGG